MQPLHLLMERGHSCKLADIVKKCLRLDLLKKVTMKKNSALMMVVSLLMAVVLTGCASDDNQAATRTITDMAGNTVEIPASPQKIATMTGPSYEMVFMLGGKDKIGLVRSDHATGYPLALLTNPDLPNYPTIKGVGPQTPVNAEQFLDAGVDLVLYYNNAAELEKFKMAGIPAVVVNTTTTVPTTTEEYFEQSSANLKLLSEILGGEAVERYEKWYAYLTKNVELIAERTKDIKEEDRPVVYWGNTWGTNILSSYSRGTRDFEMELCGGTLVAPQEGGQFPEINKEQLLEWNPDIIFVDNHGNAPELVIEDMYSNKNWESLSAVQNKQLYRIPSGVFFMDKGSTNTLVLLWTAKVLHPDLFADIDMIKELQYYYSTFYDYDLSEEEAQKILEGWVDAENLVR